MTGFARRHLGPVLLVGVVALLLAATARTRFGRALEDRLCRDEVPARLDVRNRLRTQLADLLFVQPPANPLGREPLADDGRCPAPRLGVRPVPPDRMPSTWRAPGQGRSRGRTLVSLAIDRCRLRWLLEHRFERGRDFEELGWVSVFEDSTLVAASPVGVRMHGNTGRDHSPFNYRLYFRRGVAVARLSAAWLGSGDDGELDQVVLKRDLGALPRGRPWPLVESVAYAVGHRLGAHVPGFRPVALSVNAAAPSAYAVSERITPSFLRRRFGAGDFTIVRGKVAARQSEPGPRQQLLDWVRETPRPLTAARAAELFDLECLLDSMATALVVGAGDPFQDALVRDRRGGTHHGRWFFVLWDHDFGFRDAPRLSRFPDASDLLPMLVRSSSPAKSVTLLLVRRLLREDPSFRLRLVRRLAAAFNHQLTGDVLAAIVAEHDRRATEIALDDRAFLGELHEALERRPRELFDQAADLFGVAPFRAHEIASEGPRFRVDLGESRRSFRGWSSAQVPVRLEIAEADVAAFSGWYEGDRLVSNSRRFELAGESPARLVARSRSAPAPRSRPAG